MTSDLKYWKDGEAVIPATGYGALQFWKDGEAYVVYQQAVSSHNIAAVSTVAYGASVAKVCGVAIADIAAIAGFAD